MSRLLLTAGLAAIAAAAPAHAQNQDEEPVERCLELFVFADENPAYEVEEMPELLAVIERNDSRECRRTLRELQRETETSETERETRQRPSRTGEENEALRETETETVREELEVQQTVVIAGTVDVASQAPEVTVQQSPPQVRVRKGQPEVTVESAKPEIVIKERPATVRVGMPTITIEQPAPIIEVYMPDPSVSVAGGEPEVTVRQAPPRVSVSVPEPQVELDLAAAPADEAGEVTTNLRRVPSEPRERRGMRLLEREEANAEAMVYVSEADARVEEEETEAEPRINVQSQEPTIRFERAEAQVAMDGEPKVEFKRMGEPRITFLRERQDQGREVSVGDLKDMTVESRTGEKIGEIERVVSLGGNTYAVLEHGGFFGVGGKEVPIPLSNLSMRGDRLVAETLTAEEVENLSDQELPDDLSLDDEEPLRLRSGERTGD